MNWFNRLLPPKIKHSSSIKRSAVPEGLWTKCSACEDILYSSDLVKNIFVCPSCGYHHSISPRDRLRSWFDNATYEEIADNVRSMDPLKFKDSKKYVDRINDAMQKTKETEALISGFGLLKNCPIVISVFDFHFMGGSMGSALGERFVRATRAAVEHSCPFLCVTASGGARMQEGLYSLMQMAKTTAAVSKLAHAGLPFITLLTHPTMGGVSASFAFISDIVLAEPNALIGFAGPRVIEQTVREQLPEGFQRSEFLLKKGAIDMIVDRRELPDTLHKVLSILVPDLIQ